MPYTLAEVDTPFVAIDLDVMQNNLDTMQQRADEHGLNLRPHTKTHKQPALAHKQFRLGAQSLTVAKLDEAEIMLNAGLDNLLIAYPLIGRSKAYRLANLMIRGLHPTVSLDSLASLQTVSLAAQLSGRPIDVLVEIDTGFHRCGLTGSAVVELASAIYQEPLIHFRGIFSFAGHVAGNTDPAIIQKIIEEEDQQMAHYAASLQSQNLPVDIISVGGTILSHNMQYLRHATEIRPGIYIFNDMGIVSSGSATVSQCAARVWTTVVSVPEPQRAILDAGSKVLSSDGPIHGSYGYVVGKPHWIITRLSEEHAIVEITRGTQTPEIGDRVSIIPNHICPVINLQTSLVGVKNDQISGTWPILARGGSR